jgi:hypothetical protein
MRCPNDVWAMLVTAVDIISDADHPHDPVVRGVLQHDLVASRRAQHLHDDLDNLAVIGQAGVRSWCVHGRVGGQFGWFVNVVVGGHCLCAPSVSGCNGRVADVYGRFVTALLSTHMCATGSKWTMWRTNSQLFATCDFAR